MPARLRGSTVVVGGLCMLLSACVGAPVTPPATPSTSPSTSAVAAPASLPAAAVQTVAEEAGAAFASPTGHIVCLMGSGEVRCEFRGPKTWKAPWPDGCELDWDSALAVADQVEGVCAGDTIVGFADVGQSTTTWWQPGGTTVTSYDWTLAVLPYGSALAVGHMRCDSASTGVTCRNLTSGHGFSMATEAYTTF